MRHPIYLDYMATTPIDPRVIEVMLAFMGPTGQFGNPASATHCYGHLAREAVEKSRSQIARVVGADLGSIIFTSGATESNNIAILGAARFYQQKGRHIITMSTEHKAVLDSMKQLEREGFEVTYLKPDTDGILCLDTLAAALREDTILVSIMHVNNEIGVIQDIAAIGDLLQGKGILFHVDAAQSAGKIPIDLRVLKIDLMSFSAHKIYGPKGVGALYVRQKPRIRLLPISFGGGHENGLRAGTLPTHQIVGMGEALKLAELEREAEQARILNLRQKVWQGISRIPGLRLNGHPSTRIAGNLNFSFEHTSQQNLLNCFKDLALSSSSACSSASFQPSYVLRELGLSENLAKNAIRLSIGRFTTEAEIQQAIHILTTRALHLV